MLYDQAQLANSYLDAYQASKDPKFRALAIDILEYVKTITSPEVGAHVSPQFFFPFALPTVAAALRVSSQGGFYSAEDADSLPSPQAAHKTEGSNRSSFLSPRLA